MWEPGNDDSYETRREEVDEDDATEIFTFGIQQTRNPVLFLHGVKHSFQALAGPS